MNPMKGSQGWIIMNLRRDVIGKGDADLPPLTPGVLAQPTPVRPMVPCRSEID